MANGVKAKEPIQFYTEGDICGQIRGAYQQPAWVVLPSLRDSTGWAGRGQTADAVAFGTWPSRGFKIIGFEIKSYRGDWLRELKNPAKAEAFALYCDEWWIVGTEAVIKAEEVPDVWGWATPTPRGLKRIKEPKPITPQEIDRVFLMAIMRNVGQNYTPTREVKEAIDQKVNEELDRRNGSAELELKYTKETVAELRKKIEDFEKAAGFEISTWKFESSQIGALVKEITDGRIMHHLQDIEAATKGVSEVLALVRALPFFKERNRL